MPRFGEILVDQGMADSFLETGSSPGFSHQGVEGTGIRLNLRMQPGYDHSYNFISTFMDEPFALHAERLAG